MMAAVVFGCTQWNENVLIVELLKCLPFTLKSSFEMRHINVPKLMEFFISRMVKLIPTLIESRRRIRQEWKIQGLYRDACVLFEGSGHLVQITVSLSKFSTNTKNVVLESIQTVFSHIHVQCECTAAKWLKFTSIFRSACILAPLSFRFSSPNSSFVCVNTNYRLFVVYKRMNSRPSSRIYWKEQITDKATSIVWYTINCIRAKLWTFSSFHHSQNGSADSRR